MDWLFELLSREEDVDQLDAVSDIETLHISTLDAIPQTKQIIDEQEIAKIQSFFELQVDDISYSKSTLSVVSSRYNFKNTKATVDTLNHMIRYHRSDAVRSSVSVEPLILIQLTEEGGLVLTDGHLSTVSLLETGKLAKKDSMIVYNNERLYYIGEDDHLYCLPLQKAVLEELLFPVAAIKDDLKTAADTAGLKQSFQQNLKQLRDKYAELFAVEADMQTARSQKLKPLILDLRRVLDYPIKCMQEYDEKLFTLTSSGLVAAVDLRSHSTSRVNVFDCNLQYSSLCVGYNSLLIAVRYPEEGKLQFWLLDDGLQVVDRSKVHLCTPQTEPKAISCWLYRGILIWMIMAVNKSVMMYASCNSKLFKWVENTPLEFDTFLNSQIKSNTAKRKARFEGAFGQMRLLDHRLLGVQNAIQRANRIRNLDPLPPNRPVDLNIL